MNMEEINTKILNKTVTLNKFPKINQKQNWKKFVQDVNDYSLEGRNKKLTKEEDELLYDHYNEKNTNACLKILHYNCQLNNLYVPKLSEMVGNCLFESLIYHGIGNSVDDLRKGLAFLMYIYRDYKDFLPNGLTLKEMFEFQASCDDIQYVSNNDKNRMYYEYTYDVMCQDLASNYSWTNLPTNIILLMVSYLYKVEIISVLDYETNNNGISPINFWSEKEDIDMSSIKKIYIGHLNNSHWVPITEIPENKKVKRLYYNTYTSEFKKFKKELESSIFEKIECQKNENKQEVSDSEE